MIQINILTHKEERFNFTLKSLEFLNKIKENNKEKIKIVICFSNFNNLENWENVINNLNKNNIKSEILYIKNRGLNYMEKINTLINSDCEYSCSMDDDIFITNDLWDYIIENINILEDEDNLFLAPLISNGIPSVDLFINDFFNDNDKQEINNIFKKTKIENMWGVDYSSLNYEKENWNMDFYENVNKINHHYKGIHPVRVSLDAHKKIADIICNNKENFLKNKNYYIEKFKLPYFCNSFYFIKTSTWKNIINDKTLFKDEFDEVPLNLYREKNDLNMIFVRNGFCLHMAYNTIGLENQNNIEQFYQENFINKI